MATTTTTLNTRNLRKQKKFRKKGNKATRKQAVTDSRAIPFTQMGDTQTNTFMEKMDESIEQY